MDDTRRLDRQLGDRAPTLLDDIEGLLQTCDVGRSQIDALGMAAIQLVANPPVTELVGPNELTQGVTLLHRRRVADS